MIKGKLRKLFAGTRKRGRQQGFRMRGAMKRDILGANLHVNNTGISEGLFWFYVDLNTILTTSAHFVLMEFHIILLTAVHPH